MREDFLHFLWRSKRFEMNNLATTTGEKIEIFRVGQYNTNDGPDFSNARIKIGDTTWAGNVEIHTNSSEWFKHGHQNDDAYDSIVLHVVYEENTTIKRRSGARIPCLELKGRIPSGILANYQKLMHQQRWIPCQNFLETISRSAISFWLDRCLVDRLEQKTESIAATLELTNNNWEETFYIYFGRSFGQKTNALPFEQLARITPIKLLNKHRNSLFQLEALLFGQAGFLENTMEETYGKELQQEYGFLQRKYKLIPLKSAFWKFARLRPLNFPTIRIAQFAALIHRSDNLLSKVLSANNVKEIQNLLSVQLSNYWQDHYLFNKLSIRRKKTLGKSAIHGIIINAIVPFTFLYGEKLGNEKFKNKAFDLLSSIPPERNHIIEKWHSVGIEADSAYQSQALLQLKQKYCDRQKCLKCAIGNSILR